MEELDDVQGDSDDDVGNGHLGNDEDEEDEENEENEEDGESGEDEEEDIAEGSGDQDNGGDYDAWDKVESWIRTAQHTELIAEVSEDELSTEDLEESLAQASDRWLRIVEPVDLFPYMLQLYELDYESLSTKEVEKKCSDRAWILSVLLKILNDRHLVNYDDANGLARKDIVRRLLEVNTFGRRMLSTCNMTCVAMNAERDSSKSTEEIEVTHFEFGSPDELMPHQSLMLHVLHLLRQSGLRKFGEDCYEAVVIECDGTTCDTHAWRKACSLKEFIHFHVRKETDYQQWLNLTCKRDNCDSVVTLILESQQFDFEELIPNREIYACRDGLYHKRHAFFPYKNRAAWSQIAEACTHKWHAMGYPDVLVQAPGTLDSAVMFIDEDFEDSWGDPNMLTGDRNALLEHMDFEDFNKILEDQGLDPVTMQWLTACLGAMLEPKGKYDQWQIMPVFKGGAQTGKSTLINLLMELFPDGTIGTISSSSEETFGLESLYEAWLCVWPEAKEKPGIPQHDLQSMITGPPEKVQVRRKNKKAVTVAWQPPIIVATNVFVKYDDPRGAMSRRLAIFPFDKVVEDGDTDLPNRLKKNKMRFLVLINVMYKSMFVSYRTKTIWDEKRDQDPMQRIVGVRMHEAHEEARKDLDIMFKFLTECPNIEKNDPSAYITKAEFMEEFADWKRSSGYSHFQWAFKKDNLTCFPKFGLTYVPNYNNGGPDDEIVEAILGCRKRS